MSYLLHGLNVLALLKQYIPEHILILVVAALQLELGLSYKRMYPSQSRDLHFAGGVLHMLMWTKRLGMTSPVSTAPPNPW